MEQPAAVVTTVPVSRANARAMSGWMKFVGIVTLISGILQALSIVGIIWAWLSIWLGILINQAGSSARSYADTGDEASLNTLTGRLKLIFKLIGILIIVSVAVSIVAGIIWAIIFATGGLAMLMEQLKGLQP
ncbi:MAG: DUF5362 family protein [candidate division WOR-3 bacterium]